MALTRIIHGCRNGLSGRLLLFAPAGVVDEEDRLDLFQRLFLRLPGSAVAGDFLGLGDPLFVVVLINEELSHILNIPYLPGLFFGAVEGAMHTIFLSPAILRTVDISLKGR